MFFMNKNYEAFYTLLVISKINILQRVNVISFCNFKCEEKRIKWRKNQMG